MTQTSVPSILRVFLSNLRTGDGDGHGDANLPRRPRSPRAPLFHPPTSREARRRCLREYSNSFLVHGGVLRSCAVIAAALVGAVGACTDDDEGPASLDASAGVDAAKPEEVDAAIELHLDASVDASYEDCLDRCKGELACCDDAFGTGVRGCTDTLLDVSNCGGCGNACREDEACLWGACGCPSGECAGRCVDLAWDPANCGWCGNECAADRKCFIGACRTCEGTGGLTCGEECPRALEDELNCGGCGTACGEGEACIGGSCIPGECESECPEDWVCCDDAWGWGGPGCTAIEWDNVNCGACGVGCDEGQTCIRGICVRNECDAPCGFGQTCCDSPWGGPDAGCTTVEWDPTNCGSCGTRCANDQVCTAGVCRAP